MDINLLNKIQEQIDECYQKYGEYASLKEALAVLQEEVFEIFEESRKHELDFDCIKNEICDCLTVLFKMYDDIVIKRNKR